MAEATQNAASTPKAPVSVTMPPGSNKVNLSPNGNIAVWVEGRIDKTDRVAQTKDGRPIYETVVFMPAIDPYSHPKRYCVSSFGAIGRAGDDICVECEIICQPWKPRGNNNAANYGNNNRHPNAPPDDYGYAGGGGNNGGGNASSNRWRYPHYLWALR